MRSVLPPRRHAETFDFEMPLDRGGKPLRFTATLGRHPSGELGEVFLNCTKLGTAADASACDAAIAVSLAIQHGTPVCVLRGAMKRNEDGKPSSPIGMLLDQIRDDEADNVALEACE